MSEVRVRVRVSEDLTESTCHRFRCIGPTVSYRRADRQTDRRKDGLMEGWTGKRTDGSADGQMEDGRVGGWVEERTESFVTDGRFEFYNRLDIINAMNE